MGNKNNVTSNESLNFIHGYADSHHLPAWLISRLYKIRGSQSGIAENLSLLECNAA